MRIEHIAIWVSDLERMKEFYVAYFDAISNTKYHNPATGLSSYFLSFDGGARIEIMHRPDIQKLLHATTGMGYAHIAFSVDSKENVLLLTEKCREGGLEVVGEPRTTGDG